MKHPRPMILAMVSAAALAATLARLWPREAELPSARSLVSTPTEETPSLPTPVVTQGTTEPLPSAGAGTFRWGQLESTNYRHYLANLRSIGCPERTIADIIAADVHGLYETKRRTEPANPTKAARNSATHRADPGSRITETALWQEEERVLRALLGSPPQWWETLASAGTAAMTASRGSAGPEQLHPGTGEAASRSPDAPAGPMGVSQHAGLSAPQAPHTQPPDFPDSLLPKAVVLSEWLRKTETARHDLQARRAAQGSSSELLAEAVQLEATAAAEFDQLLSPAEREEYDFHYSPGAQDLRKRLQDVDLGEPDLRALVSIRSELDRSVSGVELSGEEFLAALKNNRLEMERTLGSEKWQEVMVRGDLDPAIGPESEGLSTPPTLPETDGP